MWTSFAFHEIPEYLMKRKAGPFQGPFVPLVRFPCDNRAITVRYVRGIPRHAQEICVSAVACRWRD